ncbi:MAG: hypothetical protein A2821_04620 [Candidatus Magasanikbacteria bacterium RIFCSPHIGHO2_01_FULL_41_23]|uniref:Gluconeogenesis factor n=1 Tax=Candidatus Magasanikbacteria bacterium RIFCSPLOWO2_01_FULL_40_15 TaxID=1798686 RepID=A0A1F6N4E1_9BACT|nr:MAG: hypothetical protein A2821_04620 [Candidatus Magasanikbacteria bacterium RIFCSPHIGHO2_01_FULL_41_23]OGH67206.1 MAG: hypothetical protein A3C66_02930 [Candidatus Magasanikbacteria bacterium RIFCSPHIGHO2_02_FULL_41_35]OGH75428.1 MAG: hypothetical protein A3F22_01210 [Candidatus Magasanikbacteria bacterium RIFCSPHIGHO2_12_FULL_41_16]OGH78742.1 MAG: hypothetical protein A2983_04570 [Candidatus Magasanikbacteria bacterium RIFCSPLOWO2_01_FULL_40_15]
MKKIVVIGGGTGTVPVLSGLKKYSDMELSVIVSMTDDGGSNAVVRDEFGLLPLSDVRKSIIALAETDNQLLRELFTYRFAKGEGLSGHTLGNLMMLALADMGGSELIAIQRLSELFQVKGIIIPVTLGQTNLIAEYYTGQRIEGEHSIEESGIPNLGHVKQLSLSTPVQAYVVAIEAIKEADIIIAGPGDLYTSVLANIIIPGISAAIVESQAKFIFINNLMTKYGQTHNFTATDLVGEITRYSGRKPDVIVVNNTSFPAHILDKYSERGEYPIIDDLSDKTMEIIRRDIINLVEVNKENGDVLMRSLIRHDSQKLSEVLYSVMV